MAMFRRGIIIETPRRLKRMRLAGTEAYHRVRVASPEVLQRLRWRNWALPGAPPSTRAAHAASAPPPCLRGSGGGGGGSCGWPSRPSRHTIGFG